MIEFVGEVVARIRSTQTGVDRYGNPVYSDVETTLPERAAFAPKGSSLSLFVERETTITKDTLYFPNAHPDVRDDDRLRVRGRVRTIEGRPQDFRNPFAGITHGGDVVELEDVEG